LEVADVRNVHFASALLLVAMSSACVSDKAYRGPEKPSDLPRSVFDEYLLSQQFDPTQTGVVDKKWRYRLAFVEFNDRGEMFYPQQLNRAVEAIGSVKREASALQVQPVVAVFVHGWKNNASDSSGNVWGFRQVLAGLKLQYDPAPVLGVYIGWRGAVLSPPILKEFTFFDRHRRSQRVGGAQMPDALRTLMQAAKGPTYEEPTISVLIGHSFGGAVLETAVTQGLAGEVTNARKEGRDVRWPADLIILLNEAQEAERSYPFIETLVANVQPRPPCSGPGQEGDTLRPAVISISSTGDYATRAFFPGAQLPARLFHRPSYKGTDPLDVGSATSLFFATTAHTAALRSHLLGRADDSDIVEATKACKESMKTTLMSNNPAATTYLIVERPGTKNRTPYWVMHMPPAIVPDHSTIFTPTFREFLISLIFNALLNNPQNKTAATPGPTS
jgi:pimeloyl-ACP methyl ester carboxylesterase